MREKLRTLPLKAVAALALLLGVSPLCIVLGRTFLPEESALWYALPSLTTLWGLAGYLLSGKKRLIVTLLGCAGLGAYGILRLMPGNWERLLPLLPCLLILLLLPPAWARDPWSEWPLGLWLAGLGLHFVGHILSGYPAWAGIETALGAALVAYAFLLLTMLNRQSLREGTHGAQRAPAPIRRRNLLLTLCLFLPALGAACWGLLGKWLEAGWAAIKSAVLWLIYWFLSLFSGSGDTGADAGGAGGGFGGLPLDEPAKASPLAALLEKILFFLVYAALAALTVWVLFFLGKRLYRLLKKLLLRLRRYADAAGEDYVDEAESTLNLDEKAGAMRDRLKGALARSARQTPWGELSGRERVRRLYRQFLKRSPQTRALTAREALTQDGGLPLEQASHFAALYERARYSDHDVSAQEADGLRKELK